MCLCPLVLCAGVQLEGVAGANVLQFLRDLRWRSVQLLRHTFLLVRVHTVKLLTQVSINHILGKTAEVSILGFYVML